MDKNLNHVEDSQDYEIAYVFFGETNNKKLGRTTEDGENTIINGYNISDIMTDKDAQAVIDSYSKTVNIEYKNNYLHRDKVRAKKVDSKKVERYLEKIRKYKEDRSEGMSH